MDNMNGKRVEFQHPAEIPNGGFGRDPRDGTWYACTPHGALASLSRNAVTEHPDGTITVSPAIFIYADSTTWWLEQGTWREEKE